MVEPYAQTEQTQGNWDISEGDDHGFEDEIQNPVKVHIVVQIPEHVFFPHHS